MILTLFILLAKSSENLGNPLHLMILNMNILTDRHIGARFTRIFAKPIQEARGYWFLKKAGLLQEEEFRTESKVRENGEKGLLFYVLSI